MLQNKKLILNKSQISQKIKRIAYEVYENHYNVVDLILAGIDEMGLKLASLIKKELEQISGIRCHLVQISVDKKAPSQPKITLDDLPSLKEPSVLIVDDVLNSGRTLAYVLGPFLKMPVKEIQTAVLVNRSHKKFPVSVDYKGYELATTIQEHIEVQLSENDFAAYLY